MQLVACILLGRRHGTKVVNVLARRLVERRIVGHQILVGVDVGVDHGEGRVLCRRVLIGRKIEGIHRGHLRHLRLGALVVGEEIGVDEALCVPIAHLVEILLIFGLGSAVGDGIAVLEIQPARDLEARIQRADHIGARVVEEERSLAAVQILLDIGKEGLPIVIGDGIDDFRPLFDDALRLLPCTQPILAHDEAVPGALFLHGNAVDARILAAVRLGELLHGRIASLNGLEVIGRTLFHVGGEIPDDAVRNALLDAAGIARTHLHIADDHDIVVLVIARPHLLDVVIHAVGVLHLDARALFEFLIDGELVVARISVDDFEGQEDLDVVEIFFDVLAACRSACDAERDDRAQCNAKYLVFHLFPPYVRREAENCSPPLFLPSL